jgi:DNA-binding GntR family transcriptional regulator
LNDESTSERPAGNGSTSITSRTYARLRRDILAGVLAPGAKLKIEELRRTLGTGASPIREALSLLTSDQLVQRIDQRGFRVARISDSEFQELLLTRAWLEERALRESIARGDTAWEESIVLAHYHLSRMPRSVDGEPNADWESCHRAFHRTLIVACGSSILLRFCDQLYDQNVRYRYLAGRSAYPERDINREHEELMQAVLERDSDLAVERLLAHYRLTGRFLSKQFGG